MFWPVGGGLWERSKGEWSERGLGRWDIMDLELKIGVSQNGRSYLSSIYSSIHSMSSFLCKWFPSLLQGYQKKLGLYKESSSQIWTSCWPAYNLQKSHLFIGKCSIRRARMVSDLLLSLWPISLLCTWASLFFLVLQDIATSLSSWTLCGPSFLVGSPSPSPLQAGWLWWLPFQFTHLSLFQSQRKLALLLKSWWETFCGREMLIESIATMCDGM